jgi:serine/threonine-protein kinase RsbW
MMSESLKLTIPGSPEYIKIAKVAVGQAACLHGLDIEKTDDLQMAVGEACRLISCHGHSAWSDTYSVIFTADEEEMTVTVIDENECHSIEKAEKYRCLDCPHEGDMGLKLLECVMDKVEITRASEGCKSIKVTKKIK